MEEILDREVSELQSQLAYDTGLAPAEREFNLVIGFGLEVEHHVDSTVVFIGLHVGIHVLGIEMSGLSDFAQRTYKVALAEQFARFYTELAADNLFVKSVVAVDGHIVDSGLRTFHHTHFQRYAVAGNFAFDRHEVIEQVTVVHVQVGHSVLVFGESLVHQLLVVYVAGLEFEIGVEYFIGVYRVAHPCNILDIVLASLVDVDVNIDHLLVVRHYRVSHDFGVAIALFVVLLEYAVKVVAVIVLNEFFLLEQVQNLAVFIGFLHGALQLVV